jgi:CBS-domain-containing membrane protein
MIHYEILESIEMPSAPLKLMGGQLPVIVHLDDPATDAMWDFNTERLQTVPKDLLLSGAIKELEATHSHHLLVVDHDGKTLLGIANGNDLLGEKPIKWQQDTGNDRSQLKVCLLMTPVTQATIIAAKNIDSAKIGNIVHTFQDKKTPYIIVLNDDHTVRGIFSYAFLKKQLHHEVPMIP